LSKLHEHGDHTIENPLLSIFLFYFRTKPESHEDDFEILPWSNRVILHQRLAKI